MGSYVDRVKPSFANRGRGSNPVGSGEGDAMGGRKAAGAKNVAKIFA